MKKYISVIVMFLITVNCFVGCGFMKDREKNLITEIPEASQIEETESNIESVSSVEEQDNVDYAQVREKMSNYCNMGLYCIHDGWIYTLDYSSDNGKSLFSKMRTDRSDYTVLTKDGSPEFISIDGEYIYFVLNTGKNAKLYRCRLGGNDLTQLTEDDVWHFHMSEDYLYYCKIDYSGDNTTGFYRSNKDGSDEKLIMDKEIYYPYVIGDNLYYQDDKDNETTHKYSLIEKIDERITSGISYSFVVDGKYGYYISNDHSTRDDDYEGFLVRIDLGTKEETVLYDGASTEGIVVSETDVYFINTNDENRIYKIGKDGENVKLVTQDNNCAGLSIFGNRLIYMDFDDNNEYIDAIYMCSEDGSNKIKINN